MHDALKERPLVTLQGVARYSGLSFPTATAGMNLLVDLGIARELTGKKRNRVFVYDRYLPRLAEGMDREDRASPGRARGLQPDP